MERLHFAHQFHPVVAYGDAVGNDCFELQRMFWSSGVRTDLFAWEAKPEVRALVRDWKDLERVVSRDGLLLVHHSMGNDTVSEVAKLPARKAVVYHNITPARYFEGLNEHARRYAEVGREQLLELAKSAEFGFADSEYNRRELAEAGCANTVVVPIAIDWEQYDVAPDPKLARAGRRAHGDPRGRADPPAKGDPRRHRFLRRVPHVGSGCAALPRRIDRHVRPVPRAAPAADREARPRRCRDLRGQRDHRAAGRLLPRRDRIPHALRSRGVLRPAPRGNAQRPADRRPCGRCDPGDARRRWRAARGEVAICGRGSARARSARSGCAQGSPREGPPACGRVLA